MTIDLKLGVTGLRRTGKTVFLTALIHHLIHRGNLGMKAFGVGDKRVEIEAAGSLRLSDCNLSDAWSGVPEFPYAENLAKLRGQVPDWPSPTDKESQYVLEYSIRYPDGDGWLGRTKAVARRTIGRHKVRLHLHDYPGEFLLDVPMLAVTFEQWSEKAVQAMKGTFLSEAQDFLSAANALPEDADQAAIAALRGDYAKYLIAARQLGLEMLQPAISLLKAGSKWESRSADQLANEDFLPFIPIPVESPGCDALLPSMRKAFDDYKQRDLAPFALRLREASAQVVFVDVLRVLRNGAKAINDLSECLKEVMSAYRYRNSIFGGGIKRVVFAATKADHVLNSHRPNLRKLLESAILKARAKLGPATIQHQTLGFTSIRATEDIQRPIDDKPAEWLKGILKDDAERKSKAHNPGILPEQWPGKLPQNDPAYRFPEFRCPDTFPDTDLNDWQYIGLDQVAKMILIP